MAPMTRSESKGSLTIFAGYAPGSGKTYAMLEAAERARQAGAVVVSGLVAANGWPQTQLMADRFETLPCKQIQQGTPASMEIDLDAALHRMPQLILIDDLSHQNPDGCRHKKRYQDIEELLKAGIDVYTTLDIQHIESLQDTVSAIIGHGLPERVPDSVFDAADRVEFADLEPQDLLDRLKSKQPGALSSPLSVTQLNALRELGLRRCADRIALHTRKAQKQAGYRTHEHILVCLSSAPSNAKIIRTAARMAGAFRCSFTALFVETKQFQWGFQADKDRLRSNIRLAEQLGASVETVYGDDIPYQIAEFARLSGVTKIMIGRSGISRRTIFRAPSLTERLIELAPELDIHIIPDNGLNKRSAPAYREPMRLLSVSLCDLVKSVLLLLLATLVGFLFFKLGFTEANIITIYILSVMLISVTTKSPVCSFISSAASVLIFNFFFTEPRYSLHAYDSGYLVTFLVMFIAALITGSLASKLKSHAQRAAQVAWRTKLLFETNQSLQKAMDQSEIMAITARQLVRLFQRDIVVYRAENGVLSQPILFCAAEEGCSDTPYTSAKEQAVAQWVMKNNRRAGTGTETFSDSLCVYWSVRIGDRVYGVIGIAAKAKPLDSFENGILLSVLGECALALENQKNAQEKEAAAVLAKNEQLRANLLRSISHDLRTPLTAISGNASNLLSNGKLFDAQTKEQMYTDIYDDAMWLINLVENLLSVSRLEEGRMNLHMSTELMDEVIAEALRHINRKSADYHLIVREPDEYILVQIDVRLIVQVLINIIDNAIKYTPVGSDIRIEWKKQGDFVLVSIADNGPGISDEAKPHIFEMFYSASAKIADSRRSMGLGLALCKSIVNAHGGEISVADQIPHGTIFTFSIPSGEVELHE